MTAQVSRAHRRAGGGPVQRKPHVAYFCMEFGLHESFPIYSGGLGILAGDFIKAAHDLGKPLVAIGLRWDRGYCTQTIGADGKPHDEFPRYDYSFLEDTDVRVRVRVRGEEVPCRVWHTQKFGHVPLYLIEPVLEEHRWITHRLYQSGTDVRLAQELLLGIGGMRALEWLGIPISTYHFNEGHAVFAGIEHIASIMESGVSFEDARRQTREKIVFTTHTPVKAGNEEHPLADLRRMGACLQLSDAEMLAIGGDPFNMTVAGLRLSRLANAVSVLHTETSRLMWHHVDDAAPIVDITNAVHAPTWQASSIRDAADDAQRLWSAHEALKGELVAEIQRRERVTLADDAMIIAFARRAAGYKRSDLVLRDLERLEWLIEQTPIHLVFSGKAHPDDLPGKEVVSKLVAAQRRHPGRVVFLENYNMALGRLLTRGADVWLNNPIRPLEASGTSGMKAAFNGVLNLSILDGWWPEGCEHGVNGWAFGEGKAGNDAADLAALYDSLRDDVLPAWNDRARWISMMQASIRMAQTHFPATRMVNDYFEKLYEPAGVSAGV
jgi:starch phosphorylase